MFFRVFGADRDTGDDDEVIVEAASSEEAAQIANRSGLLVADVLELTDGDDGSADRFSATPRTGVLTPNSTILH
jgi:hypothetical protein